MNVAGIEIEILRPNKEYPRARLDLVPIDTQEMRGLGGAAYTSYFGVRVRWRDAMNYVWREYFCRMEWGGKSDGATVTGTFDVEGRFLELTVPVGQLAVERPEGKYQDTRSYDKGRGVMVQEWQAEVTDDSMRLWMIPGAIDDPKLKQLLARTRASYGDSFHVIKVTEHTPGKVPGYMYSSVPRETDSTPGTAQPNR
jgi:hypothetical protein